MTHGRTAVANGDGGGIADGIADATSIAVQSSVASGMSGMSGMSGVSTSSMVCGIMENGSTPPEVQQLHGILQWLDVSLVGLVS